MEISLRVLGEIEVEYDIDSLYIDPPGEKVRTNETAAISHAEVVEDFVAVLLLHLRMDIVA